MDTVEIPCAPYGGFFFHSEIIDKINLPDERYFLYADDFEYTYRVTKYGGQILLVCKSLVKDVEDVWFNKEGNKKISYRFLDSTNYRMLYSVRNTAHFIKKHLVTNKFIFAANYHFYMMYILMIAFLQNKLSSYGIFKSAIQDGLSGNFNENYKST